MVEQLRLSASGKVGLVDTGRTEGISLRYGATPTAAWHSVSNGVSASDRAKGKARVTRQGMGNRYVRTSLARGIDSVAPLLFIFLVEYAWRRGERV